MQRILFKAGYRIVFHFVKHYDDIYFDNTIEGLTLEEARFLTKLCEKLYDGSAKFETRLINFKNLRHWRYYERSEWYEKNQRLIESVTEWFASLFSENQGVVQKFAGAGVERYHFRKPHPDEQIRLFEDFRGVLETTIVGAQITDETNMTHFEVQYFPNDVIVEDVTEDFLKG